MLFRSIGLHPIECAAGSGQCDHIWDSIQALEWSLESQWLSAARCEVEVDGESFPVACGGKLTLPSRFLQSNRLEILVRAISWQGALWQNRRTLSVLPLSTQTPRLIQSSVREGVFLPQVAAAYLNYSSPVFLDSRFENPVQVEIGRAHV